MAAPSKINGFLAALARTEDDPDFTIKLAGYTWRVHLEVLAGTSTFFESLQRGAFKESDDRSVELHDDDPWIFARILQFAYTREVSCTTSFYSCAIGRNRADNSQTRVSIHSLMIKCEQSEAEAKAAVYDSPRHALELDIEIHVLAKKYGFTQLVQSMLKKMRFYIENDEPGDRSEIYLELLWVKNRLELDRLDLELKKTIVDGVACRYSRLTSSDDEDDARFLQWVHGDLEFLALLLPALDKMKTYKNKCWNEGWTSDGDED